MFLFTAAVLAIETRLTTSRTPAIANRITPTVRRENGTNRLRIFRRNRLHLNHHDFGFNGIGIIIVAIIIRDVAFECIQKRVTVVISGSLGLAVYILLLFGRFGILALDGIENAFIFCPTRRKVLSQPKDLRLLHLRLQLFAKPVSMFCLVLSFVGTSVIVDCISECGKCITDFCRHLGLSHPEQFGCILNRQFTAIPQKKDLTL